MKKQKQFLVLLDASERAMDTIRYVAECEPFREACLVLFYVYSDIPEYYWDLDNDPQRTDTLQGFRAWQKKRIEKINAFMEEAKGSLTDNGFSEENVAIRIHQRERGVARDILDEAGKGYDGVILRRRGMGRFKGAALGSVSSKLLSKLPDIPIMLAGKKLLTRKILIGVDGSPSSVRAVEYVAGQFGGFNYSVELFHVIRGVGTLNPTNPEFIPTEIFDLMREEVTRQIKKLKEQLIAAGFEKDNVSGKIISGVDSRAEAIVRQAEDGNFGTIVVGRKGISRVQDFFMGRVCYKVIHSGRDFTVWII